HGRGIGPDRVDGSVAEVRHSATHAVEKPKRRGEWPGPARWGNFLFQTAPNFKVRARTELADTADEMIACSSSRSFSTMASGLPASLDAGRLAGRLSTQAR